MKTFSVITTSLYFLILTKPAQTRTCQERLDVLENVVQSLIESQKSKLTDNVELNKKSEDNPTLKGGSHALNKKIEDLEILLSKAYSRIQELEVRVSEIESAKMLMKTKPLKDTGKNRKSPTELGKIRPKKEYLWPGTMFSVIPRKPVQSNSEEIPINVPKHEGNLVRSDRKLSRPDGKRLLTGIQSTLTPSTGGAAFSAYVSVHETDISKGYTIRFDTIVTNIGNHYNQHSGMFTAPDHGVYVFSWKIYCNTGGYIFSQLVVNSNVAGAMLTTAEGSSDVRSTTDVVVVEVNAGDVVYVRTHPTHGHSYNLFSHPDWRSSFSGWVLY